MGPIEAFGPGGNPSTLLLPHLLDAQVDDQNKNNADDDDHGGKDADAVAESNHDFRSGVIHAAVCASPAQLR